MERELSFHHPRKGDKVHDFRRVPHANGTIHRLIWDGGSIDAIVVKFDNGMEWYDRHEFEFHWTSAYGGTYILDKEP